MLSSIIIGGGPGGLGPIIWAAQHGRLPAWLQEGVAIVEQQGHLGGSLGRCGIPSDSLGGSYLEAIYAVQLPTQLHHLRRDPITQKMETYRHTYPPLQFVDQYFGMVGKAIGSMLTAPSALYLEHRAEAIRHCPDGTVKVTIVNQDGATKVLHAKSAIVALGGQQFYLDRELKPGLTLRDCFTRRMMLSDRALSVQGLEEANNIIENMYHSPFGSKKILILGGAHSAYSVAATLLTLPAAERLKPGQIVIMQRREPKIFYPTRQMAREDGYAFDEGDICPRTQRVNRMQGIRGYGRDMWLHMHEKSGKLPEPRVISKQIQDFTTEQLRQELGSAALVIPCFGYRSKVLPIFDAHGEPLDLNAKTGGIAVDQAGRMLLSDGTSLPNIYGIGLGTGYKLIESMGGEPNFNGEANSSWLYHNDIGEVIYCSIHGTQPTGLRAESMLGTVDPKFILPPVTEPAPLVGAALIEQIRKEHPVDTDVED